MYFSGKKYGLIAKHNSQTVWIEELSKEYQAIKEQKWARLLLRILNML